MTVTNKPYVILDTNIFATYWFEEDENCNYIFDEILYKRKIQLLFSQETIGELMYSIKNLLNKYKVSSRDSEDMLKEIAYFFYYAKSVNTKYVTVNFCNDPDDNIFLECAIVGNADFLISNDIDSGIHKYRHNGLRILTPKEFVDVWKTEYEK